MCRIVPASFEAQNQSTRIEEEKGTVACGQSPAKLAVNVLCGLSFGPK